MEILHRAGRPLVGAGLFAAASATACHPSRTAAQLLRLLPGDPDAPLLRVVLSSSRQSRGRACPAPAWRAQWRSGTCSPAEQAGGRVCARAGGQAVGRRARHGGLLRAGPQWQQQCTGSAVVAAQAQAYACKAAPAGSSGSGSGSGSGTAGRGRGTHRGDVIVCQLLDVCHALPGIDQLKVLPLLQAAKRAQWQQLKHARMDRLTPATSSWGPRLV